MTDMIERVEEWAFARGDPRGGPGSILMRDLADEVERLRGEVRRLTTLLDEQLGTPCEQIRHQQEMEAALEGRRELQDAINKAVPVIDAAREVAYDRAHGLDSRAGRMRRGRRYNALDAAIKAYDEARK